LVLGTTNTTTFTMAALAASQTLTIPNVGGTSTICTSATASCSSAYQVVGNYLVQAPTSTTTNTIAPVTANVVALTVKGTNNTSANVLEVFDSTATPVRQAYFNAAGSLNVSQAIMPTAYNTIDLGSVGTTFRTAYFGTSVVSPIHQTADTNSAAATSDALILRSGNSGAGNSGSVTIDSGNGMSTDGDLFIGNTYAPNIQIGRTSGTNTNIGIDGLVTVQPPTNAANALLVQNSTNVSMFMIDTSANKVIIGSSSIDTTQILLQLDSFSTFADTATCGVSTNQGAIYYNTNSTAVRACINGAWEDLVSTASLGLQLFGVVPDSGTNPGDLAAVTGAQNGPCKVSVGANTTTVSWTSCVAFSGGRKVIVAAGTATTAAGSANQFSHLCLSGTDSQPALSARGTEVANLATISMPSVSAPVLCLADIKFTGVAATITQIYDTRTYTTTEKVTISVGTTAPALGHLVSFTATKGVVIPNTVAAGSGLAGVVVATTGATSTTTINAIIAMSGPAAVKSITGTNLVSAYLLGTTTAGYANTAAAKPAETTTTIYNVLGNARTVWSGATACTANNDTCAGSVFTYIDKR
jgi:hypothetical protein